MPQQSCRLREKGHLYNLVYVEGRGASTILQTKREGAGMGLVQLSCSSLISAILISLNRQSLKLLIHCKKILASVQTNMKENSIEPS